MDETPHHRLMYSDNVGITVRCEGVCANAEITSGTVGNHFRPTRGDPNLLLGEITAYIIPGVPPRDSCSPLVIELIG